MNNVVLIILLLIFQLVMNVIAEKIGYKLNKVYYVIGFMLNLTSSSVLIKTYGITHQTVLLLIVITILISSCLIDWKYQELPDSFNLTVGILGIINIVMFTRPTAIPQIICAVSLFTLFFALAILTGAIGGGDIKLMGAVGLFFHYVQIPRILMYGFFPGAIYGLILIILKKKKKDDMIAFGPFLVLGVILTMLI